MDDNKDGFGAPKTATGTVDKTDAAATPNKPLFETAGDIGSNHNSVHKVNPIITANLSDKSDYNPMRMTGNRANDATDTTLVPESAAALVGMKGDRPTAAEDAHAGKRMDGTEDASKVSRDTIITDPVTRITTRVNDTTLADDLAASDRASAAA